MCISTVCYPDVAAADGYFALLFQNALIQVMLNPFLRWEKAEKANGEKEKE